MPNDLNGGTGRLRNIQDDPFAVRANRETTAGELLFSYDPTPGTWMYEWDNDRAEDAKFAFNLGFVFPSSPNSARCRGWILSKSYFFCLSECGPCTRFMGSTFSNCI